MASEENSHNLSWPHFEVFLRACQEEIGTYSLQMFLQQAELPSDYLAGRRSEQLLSVPAGSYARLQELMRNYYGTGARGLLNRVGRAFGGRIIANFSWVLKARMWLLRLASKQYRRQVLLKTLGDVIDPGGERISIHTDERDLMWVDRRSFTTIGQDAEHPICYITTGMLQASLAWVTGSEHDVEEISCRACGDEVCRFQIRG